MLKFSDVFSGKNGCFQYFLNFSPRKIPDAKVYRCFLAEKYRFPISLEFFSRKNTCCQNFSMFSWEKMPVSNISRYFRVAKFRNEKIIVVLPIKNTHFLNLPLFTSTTLGASSTTLSASGVC